MQLLALNSQFPSAHFEAMMLDEDYEDDNEDYDQGYDEASEEEDQD